MQIYIGDHVVGDDHPVFIIAEMSCNHLQNYKYAVEIIKKAKLVGADAIKIQTYTPDTMTLNCNNEYFQMGETIWEGKNLYQLYQEAYTPWEWQDKLKKVAEDEGLLFFSTPFDKSSVDFLENLGVKLYKIASYEIMDIPLIDYVASKGKPVIFSIGLATLTDIELALNTIRKYTNEVAILKCTSAYPTPIEEANIITIKNIKETFNVISGLSDHTDSITSSILSVAYGAKIIEKHLTLDRSLGGSDALFSLEPDEFKVMVKAVRDAEKAIGNVNYELSEKQKRSRQMARSLFVIQDIKKGEMFSETNIRSIRPGYGLHPKYLVNVLGKCSICDIKQGTPLKWEMIEQYSNSLKK